MAMKSFNVGIKAVIQKEDKFLVLHSPMGFWDFPGGRIDDEESIQETLTRELKEELPSSRDAVIGDLVAAYRKPKFEVVAGIGLVLLMYKVTASFADDIVEISDEHDEYRWVTAEEAESLGSDLINETMRIFTT